MKILVIGGTGNLSKIVLDQLLDLPYSVDCLTRGSKQHLEAQAENRGANFINYVSKTRITQADLPFLADQYDFVIDFVTYSSSDLGLKLKLLSNRIKKAYIYISTTAFYKRPFPSLLPWQENNIQISAEWNYAVGKYEAEQLLSSMSEELVFKTVSIRLGHTVGTSIPVFLGNPGHAFIDHIASGMPIPIIGSIDHPWSIGTASGLGSVISQIISHIAHIPKNFVFHFSETITTWHEIYSVLCEELNMPLRLHSLTFHDANKIAQAWTPSILFHKMHDDRYDLSLLETYLRKPELPQVLETVRLSLSVTRSSPREETYESERALLQMLLDSSSCA